MPENNRICILLTATIDPGDMIFLKRNEPVIRENDYIESIRKWLSIDEISSIVFCENSDYNLEKIKNATENTEEKNLEFIQTDKLILKNSEKVMENY